MEAPTERSCAVCEHPGPHATHVACERMFGTRLAFPYFACAGCGVLQIRDVPADLSPFYPREYYAHQPSRVKAGWSIRRKVRRRRLQLARLPGLRSLSPLSHNYAWVAQAGSGPNARMLDVGCGTGRRLLKLHEHGFVNLTGVDPYIESDIHYPNGVAVHKKQLREMNGTFDLVMAHHSYEHMPDPRGALREMARLCAPDGAVLLRIPLTGTHAWRTYGVEWVQLDAPRHLFLFTPRGMEHLARAAGLTVASVVFDSTGFQLWGSEQYKRGFSLKGPDQPAQPLFSADERAGFERQAAALNARQDGDQASFLLRKAGDGGG